MALSSDIISQFAKLTKSDKPASKAETVYGTIVEYDGSKYVKLDGSDLLTPVSSTTNAEADERVTVMIKDHTATVTGNLSSPAARTAEVSAVGSKISEFETIVADKVDAKELVAAEARIKDLEADNVTINKTLTANQASIKELETGKLSAESADIKYANIDFTNIGQAAMEYFYATSGLIKNVTVGDQTITGNLVGVTISGDLIEGNTIVAEKLVIKGDDGLYYKLNTDGMNIEAQQTDYNSLNGSIIKAKSITATKISVSDLVAFDATIGGFNITDSSLYSGVKESVGNTTRGVYLDKTGQIAFGDSINYIKYFKDTDGSYKLAISADVICMSSGKNIGSVVEDLENRIIENGSNATYVQFTQPVGTFNVGDVWVKAVDKTTWSTLKGKTWADVRGSLWGEIGYSDEPVTYVWNGLKWVLTVDYNIVKSNSTSITQTRNEITLKADQTVVDTLSKKVTQNSTEINQNAKAIELKANKTDPAGKVETSSVRIDDAGVEMSGGEIAVKAGAAVKIESGGTFEVASGNFEVNSNGDVTVKGKVTAEDGSIGGWDIGSGSFHSGTGAKHVQLSAEDATYGIWAGNSVAESAPFRVARDGTVYLTKLYVTDENGNEQSNPVNLRTSYWKMDVAYAHSIKELSVENGVLTIELYDGTKVNFKKAGYTASQLELQQGDPLNRDVYVYDPVNHTYNCQKTVYLYDTSGNYLGKSTTVNETSGTEAFAAGWAAAVAMLQVEGNVIKGPGADVGVQTDLYAITADGSLNAITNTAANYFNVNGYAYAYINGERAASKYISKANQINVGQ